METKVAMCGLSEEMMLGLRKIESWEEPGQGLVARGKASAKTEGRRPLGPETGSRSSAR